MVAALKSAAVVQVVCRKCREKFDKGKSGAARGMCPPCYRRSLPDRKGWQPRVEVGVEKEKKVGLTEEQAGWLEKRAKRLGVPEAEVIREAVAAAMRRAR